MSSESDNFAFERSVEPHESNILFKNKNWTYITDSTSTGGNFTGQLQFDLNTLASQSQWVDLSQAYIQFPVRVKITNLGSSQTPSNVTVLASCLKNGFHQFVDSVQLVLDGSTVQTSQIFENINTQYKILTEWSQDELRKYGPSLGIALDDYVNTLTPSTTSANSDFSGLNNVPYSILAPSTRGVDLTTLANPGIQARQYEQNISSSSGASFSILGNQATNLGKSSCQIASGAVNQNADAYVQFVLATIRLKDISPVIERLPMTRNLKGFIYINYNSSQTTVNYSNASPATVSSWSTNNLYGRCAPALLNSAGFNAAASTPSGSFRLDCEISGVPSSSLTTASPTINYARLVCPYYIANPSIDSALSMRKTFRYLERNMQLFNLTAGQSLTVTLSPGISNPKRVILFPYFTQVNSLTYNPLISPFDTVPGTTSPLAALKDLQISVGNVPMFQNPVNMDYDMFLQEIAQQGIEGGMNNELSSGLLSQRQWQSLYRFYTCDISRRLESEDGSSKSVIVQCTNATSLPMSVIAFILYEKEITIDTSMGRVFQGSA